MTENIPETIWIVTEETVVGARGTARDTGGILRSDNESIEIGVRGQVATPVSVETLKQQMSDFVRVVNHIFSEAQKLQSGLQLDELTLSVEISAQGQVNLLGIGGNVGSKGAIQLKFKRKDGQD